MLFSLDAADCCKDGQKLLKPNRLRFGAIRCVALSFAGYSMPKTATTGATY